MRGVMGSAHAPSHPGHGGGEQGQGSPPERQNIQMCPYGYQGTMRSLSNVHAIDTAARADNRVVKLFPVEDGRADYPSKVIGTPQIP